MRTARAILVDKNRLRELSRELQRAVAMKTRGREGPLGKTVLMPSAPYDIRTVDGRSRDIFIRMQSVVTQSPYYAVSGGFGSTASGKPTLVVNINGSLNAENLFKSANSDSFLIANQIYDVLLHEVTHAADIFTKGVAESLSEQEARENPKAYYNHPSEVRAYLQEILSELEHTFKNYEKFVKLFGPSKGITVMLNQSKTWQEIEPYLTEKNKRLIIKAVAQRVTEETPAKRLVARYLGHP
jgi:hypothetical protein